MKARHVLVLAGALSFNLIDGYAFPVTQEFLDQECQKTDIRVVGNDASMPAKPAKLIIAYSCGEFGETVQYEALHFICPHHGPRTVAAAVYDVQSQMYLRDQEEAGNYRSTIKLDEIPIPSCDLPL